MANETPEELEVIKTHLPEEEARKRALESLHKLERVDQLRLMLYLTGLETRIIETRFFVEWAKSHADLTI